MGKLNYKGGNFYGRLKSRSLTQKQSELFETLLPNVSIKSFDDIRLLDYKGIFIEIGFGSGEHLAQLASLDADKLFVGCELFINGIASLLTRIEQMNLSNLKVFQNDARKLFHEIPDESIDGVFLLFPDPWPKRKHIKRRFIQNDTIQEIHRILKEGGFFKIATDDIGYFQWIQKSFTSFDTKFSMEVLNSESRPPEFIWPQTRYEQKATKSCNFFLFIKKSPL
ncbi:MAG: tRNA (guanosine(46)-N7)-methyltransferase TrmB [Holosporales bacterium]|jgi:tRNA (guanine-N7-)-methyltransferase|nr:tRNA (guanosine(46)-N7)-methyltransferase TrmB [Holosporales bacterium]